MADYKKMYMILCGAVDEVIDPLEQIPMARASAQVLRRRCSRRSGYILIRQSMRWLPLSLRWWSCEMTRGRSRKTVEK